MSGIDMARSLDAPYVRPGELDDFDPPAANDSRRRRFYWAKEVRSFPPPQWLIRGLLPKNALALLYGESSSGKTTVAVDLAMRIATGMKVHESACQKGVVLHVAGEDEIGLRQRVQAFCKRNQVGDPSYAILPGRLDLAERSSVDALIADIEAAKVERCEPVVLVIIDTLARCASIDENSSREMGEVVAACDRIRHETGTAVLIIHHSGKEEKKGARGSSALRAAVDSEIQVQGKDGGRGLWVTKQRNGPAQFGWQFNLVEIEVWRDSESGSSETACTVEHLERTDERFTFGKNKGKRKGLGKNQKKLRDALEQEYLAGVACWEPDALRRLADATFARAARSTVHSAIKGMTTHGVIAKASDGRLYLVQPPKRPSPTKMEAPETIQ
jgi:hypothetical protein